MASARNGEVQITIAAPAEQVWALLSDVERMGEWSPECYQVHWLADARSPQLSARDSRVRTGSVGCAGR